MRFIFLMISYLINCIPEIILIRIGCCIGWILEHILRFRYTDVTRHLHLAFSSEKNSVDIKKIRSAVYQHFGLLSIEFIRIPTLSSKKLNEILCMHGEEHIRTALKQNKGVLLLTGHIGNWELGAIAFSLRGYKVHPLVKGIKHPYGQTFISLLRGQHGVQPIDRGKTLEKILGRLKYNAIVPFLIDQNMTEDEGIFVDFFSHPACTMKGLAVLARRSRAPIIPGFVYRDNNRKQHHCVLLPALDLKIAPHSHDMSTQQTQEFNGILEAMIRQHPEQWIWMHRRWKTQASAGKTN